MLFALTSELFALPLREMMASSGLLPGTPELLRAMIDHGAPAARTWTRWLAVAPVLVMPAPAIWPRKLTTPLASMVGLLKVLGTHTAPAIPVMLAEDTPSPTVRTCQVPSPTAAGASMRANAEIGTRLSFFMEGP